MDPANVVLMVVVFAIAISAHESAHAYVAFRCGDSTAKRQGRISLNPIDHVDPFGTILLPALMILSGAPFLFGWAKPVPVNPRALRNPKRDEALVSLAGPGANFLLAVSSVFLAVVFFPLLQPGALETSDALRKLLRYNTVINLVLAVFNLVPIHPLDGQGVLQYFISSRKIRWMKQNQMILFGLFIVLLMLGVFQIIISVFASIVLGFQSFLVQLIWL